MKKGYTLQGGTCSSFPAVQPRGSISICVESPFTTPHTICADSVFTISHAISTHALNDEHYEQPASTGPYSTSANSIIQQIVESLAYLLALTSVGQPSQASLTYTADVIHKLHAVIDDDDILAPRT